MNTLERRVWRELGAIDGFMEGASVFSAGDDVRAYFVNGTEVAHLEGDGAVELRVTRKVISAHRPRLKTEASVELRRSGSDWLTVRVGSAKDLALVRELATLAAEAHRPPPGVTAKPPPTGADLARRRRFH